ncbi:MAG: hypothetical protein JEZ08_25405 [Clostridiales bacterium]|nr:hypothetical protein [Clostridiales bacterium]
MKILRSLAVLGLITFNILLILKINRLENQNNMARLLNEQLTALSHERQLYTTRLQKLMEQSILLNQTEFNVKSKILNPFTLTVMLKEDICGACLDKFILDFDRELAYRKINGSSIVAILISEDKSNKTGVELYLKQKGIKIIKKTIAELNDSMQNIFPDMAVGILSHKGRIIMISEYNINLQKYSQEGLKNILSLYNNLNF